jgi:hypothetical protein
MPVDNRRGIFNDKKALMLARKYSLDLKDKFAYISSGPTITYNDVKFIVTNLWLDHFMYGISKPLEVDDYIYNKYYLSFINDSSIHF